MHYFNVKKNRLRPKLLNDVIKEISENWKISQLPSITLTRSTRLWGDFHFKSLYTAPQAEEQQYITLTLKSLMELETTLTPVIFTLISCTWQPKTFRKIKNHPRPCSRVKQPKDFQEI